MLWIEVPSGTCVSGIALPAFRRDILAGDDRGSDFQAERGEDVGFLTIRILDEGDAAGAVGIVLDADHHGVHVATGALEINQR